MSRFRVIDLFAGPGGLAEGFSSVLDDSGHRLFEVVLSAEMNRAAWRTLLLRAFTRQFRHGRLPERYYEFCHAVANMPKDMSGIERERDNLFRYFEKEAFRAKKEALCVELGSEKGDQALEEVLINLSQQNNKDDLVVIGGPPCQAYSLVGRIRNRAEPGYSVEEDSRHRLYHQYVNVIDKLNPVAFVMENVKGILSARFSGEHVFDRIRSDLENVGNGNPGYRIVALSPKPSKVEADSERIDRFDFVLRSEDFGVPQRRHRVFIVGIRKDRAARCSDLSMSPRPSARSTVRDVIGEMPRLRSGLSRNDSFGAWRNEMNRASDRVLEILDELPRGSDFDKEYDAVHHRVSFFQYGKRVLKRKSTSTSKTGYKNDELHKFLEDKNLNALSGHETRGHMPADLERYLFCSAYAKVNGRTPKMQEFPKELSPKHRSWTSGNFADRFRVQVWDEPSSTIVSHIAKDGHYFIHPDPLQCRSLTVREAARLQTFPDNYVFLGNRTEQFVQIGNAVPPFLAMQIAKALLRAID